MSHFIWEWVLDTSRSNPRYIWNIHKAHLRHIPGMSHSYISKSCTTKSQYLSQARKLEFVCCSPAKKLYLSWLFKQSAKTRLSNYQDFCQFSLKIAIFFKNVEKFGFLPVFYKSKPEFGKSFKKEDFRGRLLPPPLCLIVMKIWFNDLWFPISTKD